MQEYLKIQKQKIEIDKWNEGCRRNTDPGQEYIIEWIEANAGWFREAWEGSLCKACRKILICGIELRNQCDIYRPREEK